MYDSDTRPAWEALFAVASEQAGYFTTAQARACGYHWDLLSHHTRAGRFVRLRRSLYRLRDYPSSPHEEMMAAWLATGRESALVSHESALSLLDLSDVVPDAVHVIVPRARRGLPRRPGIVLHTIPWPVPPGDVTERDGMRLTAPLRTLLDVAETGTASEQVSMAVEQALRRGWITATQARSRARARGERVAALIESGIPTQ